MDVSPEAIRRVCGRFRVLIIGRRNAVTELLKHDLSMSCQRLHLLFGILDHRPNG